jgi:hypothetical protein
VPLDVVIEFKRGVYEMALTELARFLPRGKDGVVRYVIVARSASGAVNAMYEGMRCSTGEVRTYARHNASGGWSRADNSDWRSMWGNTATRHTLMFAKQGGCTGNATPRSVDEIVRSLRNQDLEKIR